LPDRLFVVQKAGRSAIILLDLFNLKAVARKVHVYFPGAFIHAPKSKR